jgi:hypothetical protein
MQVNWTSIGGNQRDWFPELSELSRHPAMRMLATKDAIEGIITEGMRLLQFLKKFNRQAYLLSIRLGMSWFVFAGIFHYTGSNNRHFY